MHLVLLPLARVPVPPTVQVSALAPSFLIDDRESLQFHRPGSGLNLDFIPQRARLPHTSDALLIRRLGCALGHHVPARLARTPRHKYGPRAVLHLLLIRSSFPFRDLSLVLTPLA